MKKFQVKFIALVAMLWFGAVSSVSGSDAFGFVGFPAGSIFWNVVGSTDDGHPGFASWINFWKHHTGYNLQGGVQCVAAIGVDNNNYYVQCQGIAGGAHAVEEVFNRCPTNLQNGVIFILPICQTHNTKLMPMWTAVDTRVVPLSNYGGINPPHFPPPLLPHLPLLIPN